jgi:hypothetical protein
MEMLKDSDTLSSAGLFTDLSDVSPNSPGWSLLERIPERAADERAADERAADAEKAETKATRKALVLAREKKWLTLIRQVRWHQRFALIWRGLANAALNAKVGELSWQPDEPVLDRMLSTPLRMFARAPANPSAALTCREHTMLTRVRLAALAARPEGAFWSIL